MSTLRFRVVGTPKQKGSAKAFVPKGSAKPVVTNDCKGEKPWAQQVHWTAREAAGEGWPWAGPVSVEIDFFMPRPKRLKDRLDVHHAQKPDIDKLTRSVLDALTGVLWLDDSRVVELGAGKRFANPGEAPGVHVMVTQLSEEG